MLSMCLCAKRLSGTITEPAAKQLHLTPVARHMPPAVCVAAKENCAVQWYQWRDLPKFALVSTYSSTFSLHRTACPCSHTQHLVPLKALLLLLQVSNKLHCWSWEAALGDTSHTLTKVDALA